MDGPINFDAFNDRILRAVKQQASPIEIQSLSKFNETLVQLVRNSVKRTRPLASQLSLFDEREIPIEHLVKSDLQTESIEERLEQIDEKLALRDDDTVESVIKRTAYVTKTFFDCEMLITKLPD